MIMPKKTKQTDRSCIPLTIKVDKLLRYGCWNNKNNDTFICELFSVKNFYFMFTFLQQRGKHSSKLCEIKEEYFHAKEREFLNKCPRPGCQYWSNPNNVQRFVLKTFHNYTLRKTISQKCVLSVDARPNPLQTQIAEARIEAKESRRRHLPVTRSSHKEEINRAHQFSKQTGISYPTVRAFGQNTEGAQTFQESYKRALSKVNGLPLDKCHYLFALLTSTERNSKQRALRELGINYGKVDVRRLDLSLLEGKLYSRTQKAPKRKP